MSSDVLEQSEVREVFERAGEEAWTVLYESWDDEGARMQRFCVLAPRRMRTTILSDHYRLPGLDFGLPGFMESRRSGRRLVRYLRYGDENGFEPLVILQNHYRVLPRMLPQLSEEFRLYHNLWVNERGTELVKVNDDGSEEVAAEIGPKKVRVRTKYLRQFQAGRKLDLVLRVDSVRYVEDPDEIAQLGEIGPPCSRDDMRLSIHVSDGARGRKMPSTHLSGVKVLNAPGRSKAGMAPFESRVQAYPEFIIDEDADGEPVKHTCDPAQLSSYFATHPDAPLYLTPVYFRREVLQRYYERPELYSVLDGYVFCAALWSLRLDNDHPEQVMVFLGDLGNDLPESERPYWQTFNVAPTGVPSRTLVRRAFAGQWADPEAPDLRFKSAYRRFNTKWLERTGWALFKEPEPDDAHVLLRLRVPLNDSQPEFENQVMGMAKVLVDALNEKAIQKLLPGKVANEKGIRKLERWMHQERYPSVDRDIAFLRRLQLLRSRLTAHRKGSDYRQVMADENVNDDAIQEVVAMLRDAECLLRGLASHGGIDLDT